MALNFFYEHLTAGRLAVFASFFIYFMCLGNVSSFVILYVYLQREFETSATDTGWVGSITWTAMNLLAPLPSALYVRISCQRVILIGVILAFVGLLATSFATELWVIYITYGLLFGAGSNFAYTATLNIVTSYYPGDDNIRATSLASCGQPVGLLVISASLERACFYLGWRNGLRIVSGFTLALGIICTILSKPHQPQHKTNISSDHQEEFECKPGTSTHDLAGCQTACNGTTHATLEMCPGEQQPARIKKGLLSKNVYQPVPPDDEGYEAIIPQENREKRQPLPQSSDDSTHSNPGRELNLSCCAKSEPNLASSSDSHRSVNMSLTRRSLETQIYSKDTTSIRNGSTFYLNSHSQSSDNNDSDQEQTSINLKVVCNDIGYNPVRAGFLTRYMRLLRLPGHWFFFIGITGSSLAALFNVIHLVSFAVSINIPETTASNLLIGMACMEIVARLPLIIFGNRFTISRNILFAVVCVMGAFATYALALWPSLHVLTIYVIILGLVRGTIYGIACGAIIDTFGVDCALESYTSLLMSYGLAGALVSIVGGISTDITGSFTISLHIIAALFLLSAVMFICAHVWTKRNPLIGQRELIEYDVNANKCDDVKDLKLQVNGTLTVGDAV